MMKPIYFPFTYVLEPVVQALAACCGPFTVYQPLRDRVPEQMQPWIDKGLIDIRVPATGNDELLEKAVNDYLNWANLQLEASGGGKNAFLKAGPDRSPLFNSSASSQIVAEIKAQGRKDTEPADQRKVMTARIFLYFAQQFDLQSRGVDGDLIDYQQRERNLIQQLQREEDALPEGRLQKPSVAPDDFADYMLDMRMEAWTRLLLSDPQRTALFITHRQAVLEHVLEFAPAAERILHVTGTVPAAEDASGDARQAEQRMAYFAQVAESRTPSVQKLETPAFLQGIPFGTTLSVYRVPGQTPGAFFARCAGIEDREAETAHPGAGVKNTLIAFINY